MSTATVTWSGSAGEHYFAYTKGATLQVSRNPRTRAYSAYCDAIFVASDANLDAAQRLAEGAAGRCVSCLKDADGCYCQICKRNMCRSCLTDHTHGMDV